MSEKDREFGALKRDLEIKSNQIENLKMEIKQHKEMMGISEGMQSDPKSRLPGANPEYEQIHSNIAKKCNYCLNMLSGNVPSEEVMRQFQHQIGDLQRKLNLMTELCKEQDEKYQKSYRDMESKLRRAVHSRDELLHLRQVESNNQQKLINQLQHGLEAFDKDKTDRDNKIQKLTDELLEKTGHYDAMKSKNAVLEKNLQTIITMLIPDLQKTTIDNVLDISIENVPKYLERFLALNNKKKQALLVECKDVINKLDEQKRTSNEVIQQERESMQMKLKEIENLHKVTLKAKQEEVENLEDEIDKVNAILKEKETCHEKEVTVLKRTIDECREESLYNLNSVKKERDMLNKKLLEMDSNLNVMHQEKLKAIKDYKDVSEKMENFNFEVQTAKQHILSLEGNNQELKNAIQELQTTLQSIKTMGEVEKAQLQGEINLKSERCADLMKRETELKEKLDSLSCTIETKVKNEEREKFQKELNEINSVVENYKGVLEQAKHEINDKETILSNVNHQLEERSAALKSSENTLELLRQDLRNTQKIVEDKDKSLVSTLLQIDDVKQKLKESEQMCARLKDVISTSDDKVKTGQKMIENLERGNADLCQKLEKNDFKLSLLQQEWDNVLNGLNEKNDIIKTLQKDKKSVAKKLKEKHERLLACEHDLTKQTENCEKHRQEITHLEKRHGELNQRCLQLEKALEDLKSDTVKRKRMEDDEEEKEVRKFDVVQMLKKLDLSDADLVSLRKLLSSQKSKDFNILKIATANQKMVTKQRAELDNLKTKIQWLKEALEVSELARKDVDKKLLIKDEQLVDKNDHIQKLEEENENLTSYLNQSQFEIKRLQMALEKTYSGVHTLVERQENAMKQAHINIPYLNNEEKLPRFWNDYIISQKHEVQQDTKQQEIKTLNSEEEEDIRFLLKEMKNLLYSALKDNQLKMGIRFSTDGQKATRESSAVDLTHASTSEIQVIAQTTAVGRNSKLLDEYLEMHGTEDSSNNTLLYLSKETSNASGAIAPNKTSPHFRASSPKSDNGSVNSKQSSAFKSVESTGQYSDIPTESKYNVQDAASTLERLQDKLINLKDMGAALTSNNKTIGTMMKKHSKKLRSLKDDVIVST